MYIIIKGKILNVSEVYGLSFDFIKDKNIKIHFIGIGGISMSGLAAILLKNNYRVSGSDMKDSHIVQGLKKAGAEIYIGHSEDNIKDVDLVVYTAAVKEDNCEYIYAKENNIALMDRAEFLGHIMRGHKYNVTISGTHGKTTSTSMLSHITLAADLDPTILVGGELDVIKGNFRTGESEYFITEACEYKASFLKFFPYIGVILNIDADHLDYYKDINHIQSTFEEFSTLIPKDGYLIGYADDSRVQEILCKAQCHTLSYGIDAGDIKAKNISFNEKGCATFDVYENKERLFRVALNVPGKHNILNALSSVCVSLILDIPKEAIVKGLNEFANAHKRFEIKGVKNGVTIVDDYAHHPTEIKATLEAAKNYPHNKIFCAFQPHTYTRTLSLFDDFVKCFDNADELILMDIYAAREKDNGLVNSTMLGDKIRERGIKCINSYSFEEALDYVKDKLSSGDLLLTVGAGDIVKLGEMYLMD